VTGFAAPTYHRIRSEYLDEHGVQWFLVDYPDLPGCKVYSRDAGAAEILAIRARDAYLAAALAAGDPLPKAALTATAEWQVLPLTSSSEAAPIASDTVGCT
jgi:hypothetical protein